MSVDPLESHRTWSVDIEDVIGAKLQAESLTVWTEDPLNAETPLRLLCRSYVTPNELFFVRNHASVPAVDADAYRLVVGGAVARPLVLSLRELRDRFPRATVAATLACAGNRRSELGRVAPVPNGIPWGPGAIGNALWTGARLGDVLRAAGILPEAKHVALTGLDDVGVEERLEPFEGSVAREKALAPEVLLAYEMNGEPLPAAHGFPLRAVVPGQIGARSVKWLSTITAQRAPSESFFQSRDYTLAGEPLRDLPLSSAVCVPLDGDAVDGGRTVVEGYAVAGGDLSIGRVEVSIDGGDSWLPAALGGGRPWTWRLWRADVRLALPADELVVRAWADSGEGQPEAAAAIWNPRGYMNNAWHRVSLTLRNSTPRPPERPSFSKRDQTW